MNVLAYRGVSLISRAIRWQTRSPYSHIALEMADGAIYEAWHVGGVRCMPDYRIGHTPGTRIDVFGLPITAMGEAHARTFLDEQVGKKYDFADVLRFLSRRSATENDKWFCSELALVALRKAGVKLLNLEPWAASPRDVTISPLLVKTGTRVI